MKAILLYTTVFAVMFFISAVDSLYDAGYFIPGIIICVLLCSACIKCITKEDLKKLPFMDDLD